ncbi:hypothetical protein NDU88_007047 [Pleurodeles waltl]|uniref:Uncharacterized protein n=1 Tax=Pleurodeles waltl TaxID=8319 RepID=A0AAV7UMS2_PLEWA|nr:hypothetical protein NDU88_007047 [Pleurodeles waltl]
MESNSVVQALRVLQEAGREDLIKEGVLEQAWVGLKRPKRSSAERVSAAILARRSPETSPGKFRKFKAKSVAGRKVSVSPERFEGEEQVAADLPLICTVRGGDARFSRRSGALLRQRVAAVGRGSSTELAVRYRCQGVARGVRTHLLSETRVSRGTVSSGGQKGAFTVSARAAKCVRAHKKGLQQAPLALESGGERCEPILEEGTLGGAANMAAPRSMYFQAIWVAAGALVFTGRGVQSLWWTMKLW